MKTYRVLVKGASKIIPIDVLADNLNPTAGAFIKLYSEKGEAYFRTEEIVGVLEVQTLARETAKSSVV
jgi:hypothetical protein